MLSLKLGDKEGDKLWLGETEGEILSLIEGLNDGENEGEID